MKQRQLGKNGPIVSAIGYGAMQFAVGRGASLNTSDGIRILHEAFDQGITFFDTAQVYGPFTNECLLGEAFSKMRDRVTIATKFGYEFIDGKRGPINSRPENIRRTVEDSLRRLKTDYIDLLYQHRVDPNVPMQEVAQTIKALHEEGKVRWFGMSEAGIQAMKDASTEFPVTALQSEYSLWWREPEENLLPFLEQEGIGFVPFAPLGRGFLTGCMKSGVQFLDNDIRQGIPRFSIENQNKNWPLVEQILEFATQHKITAAQVALAWLIHRKPFIVPIPSTTNSTRLTENIAAAEIVLTPEDIAKLDEITRDFIVSGDRYNEKNMKLINR